MKKLLLAAAAILTLTLGGTAFAADLRPAYKAPPPPPPPPLWTGFYIGANGGYSWGRFHNDFTIGPFAFGGEGQKINGGIAGVQYGYNWQIGPTWVLGTESDIQWSGQKGDSLFCAVAGCGVASITADHRLRWFGTSRGRIGVLASDWILLYATGGVAYGGTKSDYTLNIGAVPAAAIEFRRTRAGWTAGAGIEAMFGAGWSVKAEYLYIDLGRDTVTATVFPGGAGAITVFTSEQRWTDNIFRVGLNYRWNWMGPVRAAY